MLHFCPDINLQFLNLLPNRSLLVFHKFYQILVPRSRICQCLYLLKTTLKTFEQQRIFQIVNDESLSDEVKLEKFGESFIKLTELTVDTIAGCVHKIVTPEGETSDAEQIKEFVNNAPKNVFDQISEHIQKMKDQIELEPQNVKCTSCDTEFTMPVTMDQASFFAKGS
jgi:hypothetical protein